MKQTDIKNTPYSAPESIALNIGVEKFIATSIDGLCTTEEFIVDQETIW